MQRQLHEVCILLCCHLLSVHSHFLFFDPLCQLTFQPVIISTYQHIPIQEHLHHMVCHLRSMAMDQLVPELLQLSIMPKYWETQQHFKQLFEESELRRKLKRRLQSANLQSATRVETCSSGCSTCFHKYNIELKTKGIVNEIILYPKTRGTSLYTL